ncbi:hypothetical protein IFM89_013773 [Coptis chinensis]|uniref:Uncharacterized protein n=1 Tax=Coptis chinensis TaxID=261450 RepID=A0A835HVJ1_9MAGN|nr:hypothetical protein IFM89_013773 [Coptis chinensis]
MKRLQALVDVENKASQKAGFRKEGQRSSLLLPTTSINYESPDVSFDQRFSRSSTTVPAHALNEGNITRKVHEWAHRTHWTKLQGM